MWILISFLLGQLVGAGVVAYYGRRRPRKPPEGMYVKVPPQFADSVNSYLYKVQCSNCQFVWAGDPRPAYRAYEGHVCKRVVEVK